MMRVHSTVELITNSSSETYGTINASSEEAIRKVVDLILESVGYAERFDDLFEIEYVPHDLYMSSDIDEFNELYIKYDIPEIEITDEEVEDFKKRRDSGAGSGVYISPYGADTEDERIRNYMSKAARKLWLHDKLRADGVWTIFDDGEWAKPVSDIIIKPKRGEMKQDLADLMKSIWSWDTWDWN